MKNYIKKIWTIIIFLSVWIGIPHYLAITYDQPVFYIMLIGMWLPALFIVLYLEEL